MFATSLGVLCLSLAVGIFPSSWIAQRRFRLPHTILYAGAAGTVSAFHLALSFFVAGAGHSSDVLMVSAIAHLFGAGAMLLKTFPPVSATRARR
ncbi:MAG: hypothetical protein U0228_05130 [Myxococcaceae bacterium]